MPPWNMTIWWALGALARDARPVGFVLLGISLSVVIGCRLATDLNNAVRYAGTCLQILGLGMVAIGLHDTRKLFERPSLLARAEGWLKRIGGVFRGPKTVTGRATSYATSRITAEGEGFARAAPGATLEERLGVLEKNLDRLRENIGAKFRETNEQVNNVRDALNQEKEERKTELKKIGRQIEQVAGGGLDLESIGLVWLFLGTLLASVPDVVGKGITWTFGR